MMCEHGHAQPTRCALCRVREDMLAHPERYERRANDAPTRGVPRPLWFDAIVEDTRGMTDAEAEQYLSAFVSTVRQGRTS